MIVSRYRTTLQALSLWGSLFGVACGEDIPLGTAKQNLGAESTSMKMEGDCTAAKCANAQGACASGQQGMLEVTNLRCVPDPYRGVGSVPADACTVAFDCRAPAGTAPSSVAERH